MADTKDARRANEEPRAAGAADASVDDQAESERRLARWAAIGIPVAAIGGAAATGAVVGPAPAILVLAAGTLLGTIGLLWASIRTLSGDAPLPADLEAIAIRSRKVDNLGEQKRRVLRALKDLELEHSVGKIDDKDYASLGDRFRQDAKALMREMDGQVDPFRDEAERIAAKHLEKRGVGATKKATSASKKAEPAKPTDSADDVEESEREDAGEDAGEESAPDTRAKSKGRPVPGKPAEPAAPAVHPAPPARLTCPKCAVSNEPDATFCKKCGTALAAEESHA